jgi:hypothetical protein
MERSQVLEAMGELKLYGMRGAYDEILATAVKRQHEPQRVVGDLLEAEINETEAASRHRFEAAAEGAVDQVPDDNRQAAAGQGHRRLRLRYGRGERDTGARPRRRAAASSSSSATSC